MRPLLARVDLRIIHGRKRGEGDVIALFWELARLCAQLLRVDQLQRALGVIAGGSGIVLESCRNETKNEPCIKEFPWLEK